VYERIGSNVRKSWLLVGGFVVFVLVVGLVVGQAFGYGYWPLAISGVIAVVMSWGSYFNSDKIALSMSKAVPADETQYAQLHNIVESLCLAAGMQKPRVYVVNDDAPNAFATGRNQEHAAIAVTTGLMEKMSRDELEGVIAHELSHIKNRDILVMTLAVTLVGVIVLMADVMIRMLWWGGGGRRDDRGGGNAIFAILGIVLLILAPIIAQLMHFAISRRREFLADADAVFITRYPDGLISALQKLQTDQTVVRSGSRATAHLWIEAPIPRTKDEARGGRGSGAWLNRLFNTHPPLQDRIAALQQSSVAGSPPPIG
jgi:heat shock protein HtpX